MANASCTLVGTNRVRSEGGITPGFRRAKVDCLWLLGGACSTAQEN